MRRNALSGSSRRSGYPSIDINILPDRYRPRRISWRSARLWMLALSFLLMAYPAARLYYQTASFDNAALQRLTDVRTALRAYKPLAEEKSALEAQIEENNQQSAEIEAAHATMSIQSDPWSELLQQIINTVPAGIDLTMLDQAADQVSIVGLAADHRLPLTFSDALAATGSFKSVTVNSIVRRALASPTDGQPASSPAPEVFEFEMTLSLHGEETSP
jgi:Tfp pilus assembly protein PilN